MASSSVRVSWDAVVSNQAKHCCLVHSPHRKCFRDAACNSAKSTGRVATIACVPREASQVQCVGRTRRSGNFPAHTWDYNKIMSPTDVFPMMAETEEEHEMLKKEIKRLLNVTLTPFEKLELVDSLQNCGIAYHFEEEIQTALETLFIGGHTIFSEVADLYHTALMFKILRENGYKVSQDVFRRFICPIAGFSSYSEDYDHLIKGILSFYEASYIGFQHEDILDIGRLFAYKHLMKHVDSKKMESKLEKQVRHVLEIPTYYRLMRVQARWSIWFNDGEPNMNPTIMQFAKLDYNLIQHMHKQEIKEITKWWHDLALNGELNFARDRIVESYIWIMGVLSQPEYKDGRRYLTQAISILTVIDDMYDIYGSINELEKFTKAIERWDVNSIDELPHYMRICFFALFNMVHESAYHMLKEKDMVVAPYIKNLWVDLCKAYMVEAEWYKNGHKPLLEEYIENGIKSSGIQLVVFYANIFARQDVSLDDLDKLQKSSNFINWSAKIFRLNNDLSTSN